MVVENKEVLIIDDDEDIRQFLGELLLSEGYRTCGGAGGRQGVALAAQRKPDLVLLDIMMPEMDGYEVIERLKGDPVTRAIPIVMVTVKNDIADISRSLAGGASGFVVKPFDSESLLQVVEMVLTRRPFDFFTGAKAVVRSNLAEEKVREHKRIAFVDLLEPGGRKSILLAAADTPGNALMYLWQEPREEGVMQSTAAVATGSRDEFNALLGVVAARPTVNILACHVYDSGIPLP